jgi:hypothetical protein
MAGSPAVLHDHDGDRDGDHEQNKQHECGHAHGLSEARPGESVARLFLVFALLFLALIGLREHAMVDGLVARLVDLVLDVL